MRVIKYKLKVILLCLASFLALSLDQSPQSFPLHCKILDTSNISLRGRTNINSFSCFNEEKPLDRTVEFIPLDDSLRNINFQNAFLSIHTNRLECGNKKINKDLREALDASQYPEIKLEVNKATLKDINMARHREWVEVDAEVSLTIRNVTKKHQLEVGFQKVKNGVFRFKGKRKLQMTHYGIEPPSVMMGLIKVKDTIQIDFDLFVQIH